MERDQKSDGSITSPPPRKSPSRLPNGNVIRPPEWDRPPAPPASKGKPATPEQIVAHLIDLEIVFPCRDLSPAHLARKFELYLADLGHLTDEQIRTACERYRRAPDSTYFPAPGKLLDLCR